MTSALLNLGGTVSSCQVPISLWLIAQMVLIRRWINYCYYCYYYCQLKNPYMTSYLTSISLSEHYRFWDICLKLFQPWPNTLKSQLRSTKILAFAILIRLLQMLSLFFTISENICAKILKVILNGRFWLFMVKVGERYFSFLEKGLTTIGMY